MLLFLYDIEEKQSDIVIEMNQNRIGYYHNLAL